MLHFADPYPDELLFSAWVRSANHVNYLSRHAYFAELSGREVLRPVLDLPNHLDHFVSMLPQPECYPVAYLIRAHTLYPYYRPFLTPERGQRAYEVMRSSSGQHLYDIMHLTNCPLSRWDGLRYCPACVLCDRKEYGETYWHRLHQIVAVLVCPRHHCELVWCTSEENEQAVKWYVPADEVILRDAPLPRLTGIEREVAESIAQLIAALLERTDDVLDLTHRYRQLLEEHHFLKAGGRVRLTKLHAACEALYSPKLLHIWQCSFNGQQRLCKTWLGRLFFQSTWCQHPLFHMLMIRLLAGSVASFFHAAPATLAEQPFGPGPWPCLNPTCPNYHQFTILDCSLTRRSKALHPTGTFRCACGFTYRRIVWGDDRDHDPLSKRQYYHMRRTLVYPLSCLVARYDPYD